MPRSMLFALTPALCALIGAAPALAAPQVMASIKPLHSLVAGVMEGVGTPDLIVTGAASEHGYSLRPSDASRLQSADLVFWIGPDLETYLTGVLDTLAGDAHIVEMMAIEGLTLLDLREGGLFEAHSHGAHDDEGHDDDHEDHDHDAHDDHGNDDTHDHDDHHDHDFEHVSHAHPEHADAHIWLDPQNARLMVAAIAEALIEIDPDNAATYDANGQALAQRLSALNAQVAETLAPVRDIPFFVFHDAYHYFEARFDIEATGSFTVNPEIAPGAGRLNAIGEVASAADAVCLFAEPQFSPAVIQSMANETGARIGILDPLGADIPDGPELYFTLIETLAANLAECLDQ